MKNRRLWPPLLAGALAACLGSVAGADEGLAAGEATPGPIAATVAVVAVDSAVAADAAVTGVTGGDGDGAIRAARSEPEASGSGASPARSEAASPRSRKKLRFGGGPTCNCASGLGEEAIEAAARKRRLTPSSEAAERIEREN